MHPVVLGDCQISQIYDIALGEERDGWTSWVAFKCLCIKIEVSHECLKNLSCYFSNIKIFLTQKAIKHKLKWPRELLWDSRAFLAEPANAVIVIIPVKISTLKGNLDKEWQGDSSHLKFLLLLISTWSTFYHRHFRALWFGFYIGSMR